MIEAIQIIYNDKIEQAVQWFNEDKILAASHFFGEIRGIEGVSKMAGIDLDHSLFEKNKEIFLNIHRRIKAEL